MKRATEYIVIRRVADDTLRIVRVVVGYRPPNDDTAFTCGGPYRSKREARRALAMRSEELRKQLYPEKRS